MKRTLTGLFACVAGVGLMTAAQAQTPTVLTLNQWLPATHFINTEILNPWAKEVAEVTEGRVRVDIPSSSLGAPPRQFDLARQGVADIAWSTQGYTPGRFLTSEGVELPFLSDSAEALSVAFWRVHNEHFAQAKEYEGVKVLSLHVQPPGSLFTKPLVNTLQDINGLKIRVVNPSNMHMLEEFGGVGVAAPVSKTYEMLSRGIIDGTFLTMDSLPNLNIGEHVNQWVSVDGGFYNVSFFLVINERSWQRLSEADREAIESISGEAFSRRVGKLWDEKHEAATKLFQESGKAHTRIQGEMLEELQAKIGDLEENWIKAVSAKGVDGKAALEMLRREIDAYQSN